MSGLKHAFPFVYVDKSVPGITNTVVEVGMTLRDYFAANAMLQFSLNEIEIRGFQDQAAEPDHAFVAKFCYDLADAMLAERAKKP